MSISASDANQITREYLDSILIEEHLIDSVLPSLETKILGKTFRTPIMTPAFSHLKKDEKTGKNLMNEYTQAASLLGAANFVGMVSDEECAELTSIYKDTVRIIKPFADKERIIREIRCAEECGALAVGMDIDHVFGKNGSYDVVDGCLMGPQTMSDLVSYVKASSLPFVLKGVLSKEDALKSRDAGISAIMISHHHGMMPFAVPPYMLLPEIADAVKGDGMQVFADCGIYTGADVFKALALGADAVCVGRAILPGLTADGASGVENCINAMNQELAMIMGFTGSKNTSDISRSVLYRNGKPF